VRIVCFYVFVCVCSRKCVHTGVRARAYVLVSACMSGGVVSSARVVHT
jgi:hypothetical protein